jgi:rubredoxin
MQIRSYECVACGWEFDHAGPPHGTLCDPSDRGAVDTVEEENGRPVLRSRRFDNGPVGPAGCPECGVPYIKRLT